MYTLLYSNALLRMPKEPYAQLHIRHACTGPPTRGCNHSKQEGSKQEGSKQEGSHGRQRAFAVQKQLRPSKGSRRQRL